MLFVSGVWYYSMQAVKGSTVDEDGLDELDKIDMERKRKVRRGGRDGREGKKAGRAAGRETGRDAKRNHPHTSLNPQIADQHSPERRAQGVKVIPLP